MSSIAITVRGFIDLYSETVQGSADDQCTIDRINRGRILAWNLNQWSGSVREIGVTLSSGCFVLPSCVFSVLGPARKYDDPPAFLFDGFFVSEGVEFRGDPTKVITRKLNEVRVPFLISTSGYDAKLCFRCINAQDIGLDVLVRYIDKSGTLREEKIKLSQSMEKTKHVVREVLLISKPVTKGKVSIKGIRKNGEYVYEGYINQFETLPTYSIYETIEEGCSCRCQSSGCVVVRAKLRYYPITLETVDNILDINPQALSDFIQADRHRGSSSENALNLSSSFIKSATEFLFIEENKTEETDEGFKAVSFGEDFTTQLSDL